jgi:hypothetical protein
MTYPKDPIKKLIYIEKERERMKRLWEDPEYRKIQSEKMSNGWKIKKKETPEEYEKYLQNRKEISKEMWGNSEFKENMIKKMKDGWEIKREERPEEIEEWHKKKSDASIKMWKDPEYRTNTTIKMKKGMKKRKNEDPEGWKLIGKKISKSRTGIKFSEEHCKNLSNALKEFFSDPAELQKMSERMKIISQDPEVKKKYSGENHPNWQGGISYFPYCFKFDKQRKKSVRKFFKNCCIVCGKHESENMTKRGQFALCVHHVDHDKEQGCGGKPFNLVPLCHSCHTIEGRNIEEYKKYINKTLEEGFKWGIWSREQYENEVMY